MKDINTKLDKINNRITDLDWMAANAPENLYCDGERSRADVEAEYRDLYREREHLENLLKK